ncbi:D-tagatose-bisphosphate aldolase, class II, non-catalytic subunit [Pelagibacterium sp. H642]|uniref:D-tagatose-bisphosphate aldolase, class II, non-catalytic subunit n=1 Tax=Pelagibacterium sp. H642 TaxID=1881069 RepID=UPI002815BB16|nr:D-tagatose-bisphosphate aldolase, class II, non-catalytic subunit [Pelagibacterium sp. H642]WMT92657.1 D-tagatose-bisphosphate aldolase, class II, non-catalytic subunit [Pelagibacterium sp. H642]
MRDPFFAQLIADHDAGAPRGLVSVCSAHPLVIEAALSYGRQSDGPVLIEATCNQVNQDGGYTGMTPADFRDFVLAIAEQTGFDSKKLILGGDHLGPNPWRDLPAHQAMEKAQAMIAAYAEAGFSKIHLDASMECADDASPLPGPTIAARAAALAATAERHGNGQILSYVIGTEVPVPGGATGHVADLEVTAPTDAAQTVAEHREAFAQAGIGEVFERVVGLVVQPGVEFGHENVVLYDREAARDLSAARKPLGMVFEAHSTDYQTCEGLAGLVEDGFAILKVGPWLTFALREALYGLDLIAQEMFGQSSLRSGMEALMNSEPSHWQRYYHGDATAQRIQRHYSYSDRIRYYWAKPEAQQLLDELLARFGEQPIPETLISQYLSPVWPAVAAGKVPTSRRELLLHAVKVVLMKYASAVRADTRTAAL